MVAGTLISSAARTAPERSGARRARTRGYNRRKVPVVPGLTSSRRRPLGILNDFERRLEGVIEGIFSKAFRTGLQPVELANRILREMEANKTVAVREVWVPNQFTFTMSPADRER